jgi:hypothetical protein
MLAILGFFAAIFAAFLEFLGGHNKVVIILVIVGLALVCAEVAWGWNRSGRYRTSA